MSGYKALIVGVAIVLGFLLSTEATGALAPDVEWNKTFGGSDFDVAKSVQQTSDRGYIVAGYTVSYGAGSADVWILKLDSYGNLKWNKTFGGSDLDWANSVQQTSDGGYIVAGWTESYGTDFGDVWVLKLKAETSGREKPSEYKEEKPSQKMEPTAPSEENKKPATEQEEEVKPVMKEEKLENETSGVCGPSVVALLAGFIALAGRWI